MHFHDRWGPALPVMSSILISLMSCSQRGHLIMFALLVAFGGCVRTPIVALGVAGTHYKEVTHD